MDALAVVLAVLAVALGVMAKTVEPRGDPAARQWIGAAREHGTPSSASRDPASSRLPDILRRQVDAAGLDWPDQMVVLSLLGGLGVGAVGGDLLVGSGPVAWVLTAGGIVLPFLYWRHRAEVRRRALHREVADSVRALARAVGVGLPLAEAIRRYANRQQGLLAREMGRAVAGMDYATLSLPRALERVRRRLPLPEVAMLVARLGLEDTGVHMADSLRSLATLLDERHRSMERARTMLGEPRREAVAVLVAPALFALMFHLRAPAYWSILTETFGGQIALFGSFAGSVGAYFLVLRRTRVSEQL